MLVGGWIDMHLHVAIWVYAAQVLWAALIGWLLLRGSLMPAPGHGRDRASEMTHELEAADQ
jgi:hypothetical protein